MAWSRGIAMFFWISIAGCASLPPDVQPDPDPTTAGIPPPIYPSITVDAPADATTPADLWGEIRAGLALTDQHDGRIDAAIAWFKAHPRIFDAIGPGAELYYAYLVAEVARRGLPMELALLPIVESTLNPYALSRSGAAGIWQLMPATAARYGVAIDWWYDGRRDPIDSTRAALDYLEYLHAHFSGDWILAMAAYNCGEGCVARAQRNARAVSFWNLRLPGETREYVPRILALARIVASPAAYGFALPSVDLEPAFQLASIDGQVDLGHIAKVTALDHEDLFRLNPGLNRRATPPEGPHRLLVPREIASDFTEMMERYPARGERWLQYVVRKGDTLGGIAARHHTSIAAIRANNPIKGTMIRVGQTLIVPVAASETAGNRSSRHSDVLRRAHLQVARGDTLWSISRHFGTSIQNLARHRIDRRAPLRVGQNLRLPIREVARRNGSDDPLPGP
jgi:membrane-bound lytic murein transglycosylase D